MTEGRRVSRKKVAYRERLLSLLRQYNKILVVGADNVGSSQLQLIRADLRNEAVILMGKNTVIRKILHSHEKEFPEHQQLLPKLHGNLGLVFTNGDPASIRKQILARKVGAPARVGSVAPCDVNLKAGYTGLGPELTSFFHALNLSTKILRGQVEVVSSVQLIKEGTKVSPSHAALLDKLNIRPFEYGLTVQHVFDQGSLYDADVLQLTQEDLLKSFQVGVKNVAAISLSLSYPTIASIPHSASNAYKKIMHLSMGTSYTFKGTEGVKALLNDPEALALARAGMVAGEVEEEVGLRDSCDTYCDCGDPVGGIFDTFFGSDDDDW